MNTPEDNDDMIKTGEETDQSAAIQREQKILKEQAAKHELRFNTAEYLEDTIQKQAKASRNK